MPDINIRLKVSDDGTMTLLDQAGEKIQSVGQAGEQSKSGLQSLVSGATDMKAAFDSLSGALNQAGGMISAVNELGVSSIRAKESLHAMVGNQATSDLNAMRDATKGLISDLNLSGEAAFAIASGAASSKSELADLAKDGATLGIVFGKDAAGGVDDLTRALESVGNVRSLRSLGIDAQAVKAEYDKLKDSLGDQEAWKKSVFDNANIQADKLKSALNSTGTALEKLQTQWDNFKASAAENVSIGIEATISFIQDIRDAAGKGNAVANGIVNAVENTPGNPTGLINAGQQTMQGIQNDPTQNAAFQNAVNWFPGNPAGLMNMGGQALQSYYDQTHTAPDQINFQHAQNSTGGMFFDSNQQFGPVTGNDPNFDWQHFNPIVESPRGGADVDEHNRRAKASQLNFGTMDLESETGQKLGKFFQVLHDGVNNVFATINQIDAASRGFSSIREAFGLQSGGIGGELGSNMGSVQDVARQNFIDQERKKGIGGKRLDSAVEGFDYSAKKAMDDYAVATGQATRESLALRDAKANLDSAVEKGSITWDQYSKGVLSLAQAARDGQTSLRDLYTLMKNSPDMADKYQGWLGTSNLDNPAATDKHLRKMYNQGDFSEDGTAPGKKIAASDPLAAQKQSIADIQGSLNKLPAAAQSAATQMSGPAAQMQTQMSWVTTEASKALGQIAGIGSALRGMTGSLTINIGYSGGDGGRNGPSSAGWQGGQHAGAGGV